MMDWDKLRIFHAVADAEPDPRGRQPAPEPVRREPADPVAGGSLSTTLFHRHARG
jgi:hypothetical protein